MYSKTTCFSVSNETGWSLEFRPHSVTLSAKYHVQEMTIFSQENAMTAWSLLLSQRQVFFEKSSSASSIYPQQGWDYGDEGRTALIVGAQDMDTSGCEVSDLSDVAFYWENDQLDVDVVFRPSIDTPFSASTFNGFELGAMAENPISVDEEQHKRTLLQNFRSPSDQRKPLC